MVEVTSLPLMASSYVGSPDDGPMAANILLPLPRRSLPWLRRR